MAEVRLSQFLWADEIKHIKLFMTHWIVPSNEGTFRLIDYMKSHDVVDWRQGRYTYSVGDIVYIYNSWPNRRIMYKMLVERINVTSSEYLNDREFWVDVARGEEGLRLNKFVRFRLLQAAPEDARLGIEDLKRHGLKGNIQGSRRVYRDYDKVLFLYLISEFNRVGAHFDDVDSSSINDPNNAIVEGAKTTVTVNRYERNPEARQKCIEANGCSCAVCGMNFEDVYGQIGKGFIHVHHIVPISSIGEEYELDPVHDLVPVCPNCHAMLHKGMDGKVLKVEQLRKQLKR